MSIVTDEKPTKKKSVVRMPDEETQPDIPVGVGRAKREGLSTDEVPIEQKDDYYFALNDPFVHPGHEILKSPEQTAKEYEEDLAFANDVIEIYIAPSTEKFGAKTAPCWVNGKGIEIYDRQVGRWFEVGEIPRGMNVITRRKYVEVLLGSKTDAKDTQVIEHPGADPENVLRTHTYMNYPIQIIRDDNKKRGPQWFMDKAGFRR